MNYGIVNWYDEEKGYGFISCDRRPETFVEACHIKIEEGLVLKAGDEVLFKIVRGEKGFEARDVTFV